jgi:hypothetical protein
VKLFFAKVIQNPSEELSGEESSSEEFF